MSSGYHNMKDWYLAGSIVSICFSLFLIISYMKFARLRQHPSSLVFWRSIFDVIFALQFIALRALDPTPTDSLGCGVLSFVFEFSLLGSSLWYVMISVDLYISVKNPFRGAQSNLIIYHVSTWSLSLLAAFVTLFPGVGGYAPGYDICWVEYSHDGLLNYKKMGLLYVPIAVCGGISLAVLVFTWWRLRKGVAPTLKVRETAIKNGFWYTTFFILYWLAALGANLWVTQVQGDLKKADVITDANDNPAPYNFWALVVALRAVVDVLVWTYLQGAVGSWMAWYKGLPDAAPVMELNTALRREVLYCITEGLCTAVDNNEKWPLPYALPGKEHFPAYKQEADGVAVTISPVARPDQDMDHAREVRFHDFAGQVFRFIRSKLGLSERAYQKSIRGDTEAMIEKYSEGGRSGSFFYFSEDSQFIVKTIPASEAQVLTEILEEYATYIVQHPDTLLCRFVGFHRIDMFDQQIYIVVMQSIFLTSLRIHQRFDLKGSWVDRQCKVEKARDGRKGGRVKPEHKGTMKDSDLNRHLLLSAADKERFLQQVRADTNFLSRMGIMDYSLLLGIHNTRQFLKIQREDSETPQPSTDTHTACVHQFPTTQTPFHQEVYGGMPAAVIEGPGIYFMGIIDILQKWNRKKRCELWCKTCCPLSVFKWCSKDPLGISCVEPEYYQVRFVDFMDTITKSVDTEDDLRDLDQVSVRKTTASLVVYSAERSEPQTTTTTQMFSHNDVEVRGVRPSMSGFLPATVEARIGSLRRETIAGLELTDEKV